MFLANSLGGAERRGNLLEHPQLIHAMHDCGHERQFFMANTSITARISVTPSRTSIFCFRLSSPCCRSSRVALTRDRARAPTLRASAVLFADDVGLCRWRRQSRRLSMMG
jgi:hypothetical protein